jgi:hypothetical protein
MASQQDVFGDLDGPLDDDTFRKALAPRGPAITRAALGANAAVGRPIPPSLLRAFLANVGRFARGQAATVKRTDLKQLNAYAELSLEDQQEFERRYQLGLLPFPFPFLGTAPQMGAPPGTRATLGATVQSVADDVSLGARIIIFVGVTVVIIVAVVAIGRWAWGHLSKKRGSGGGAFGA